MRQFLEKIVGIFKDIDFNSTSKTASQKHPIKFNNQFFRNYHLKKPNLSPLSTTFSLLESDPLPINLSESLSLGTS